MDECISIIVPVFQAGDALRDSVESALRQTYDNIEIILVDAGSADGSGPICDEYAKLDFRVRALHLDCQDIYTARNAGLDCAKGKYIGFMDAGDWMAPDFCQKLREQIKKERVDIVACGYWEESGKRKQKVDCSADKPVLAWRDAYLAILQPDVLGGFVWNKLFDAAIFQNGLRFDNAMGKYADAVMLATGICQRAKAACLPEMMYHRRDIVVGEQACPITAERRAQMHLEACRKLIRMAAPMGDDVVALAKCRYGEAAANLLCYARRADNQGDAAFFRQEARQCRWIFYRSKYTTFSEKLALFMKIYFPMAAKIG